jgi:hypothetical protein
MTREVRKGPADSLRIGMIYRFAKEKGTRENRILIEGDPVGVEALIVNVSKSGIGMRLDSRLPAGVKATVKTGVLIIAGTIRYCVNNKDVGWFDLGFQIDKVFDTQ